jgi:hypothetical protein
MAPEVLLTMVPSDDELSRDTFLIEQRHRAFFKSKYYVYDDARTPLYYGERPFRPWGVRSNITIYEDDSRKTPLLVLRQEDRWEFLARNYALVNVPGGEVLARLTRDRLGSLLRSHWMVKDEQGVPIASAREDIAWSLRRLIAWIPLVDVIADVSMPADFEIFLLSKGGQERYVGTFERRRRTLFDKYLLDLTGDPQRSLDRRIALALGILLDTAEGR